MAFRYCPECWPEILADNRSQRFDEICRTLWDAQCGARRGRYALLVRLANTDIFQTKVDLNTLPLRIYVFHHMRLFWCNRFHTDFYLMAVDHQADLIINQKEAISAKVTEIESFWIFAQVLFIYKYSIHVMQWETPSNLLQLNYAEKIWLPPPQLYELSRLNKMPNLDDLMKFLHERSRNGMGASLLFPINYDVKDGSVHCYPGKLIFSWNKSYGTFLTWYYYASFVFIRRRFLSEETRFRPDITRYQRIRANYDCWVSGDDHKCASVRASFIAQYANCAESTDTW